MLWTFCQWRLIFRLSASTYVSVTVSECGSAQDLYAQPRPKLSACAAHDDDDFFRLHVQPKSEDDHQTASTSLTCNNAQQVVDLEGQLAAARAQLKQKQVQLKALHELGPRNQIVPLSPSKLPGSQGPSAFTPVARSSSLGRLEKLLNPPSLGASGIHRASSMDQIVGLDDPLVAHVVRQFKRKHTQEPAPDERALRRIRSACQRAVYELELHPAATIAVDSLVSGVDFSINITRDEFKEICSVLSRSTTTHELRVADDDVRDIYGSRSRGWNSARPSQRKLQQS